MAIFFEDTVRPMIAVEGHGHPQSHGQGSRVMTTPLSLPPLEPPFHDLSGSHRTDWKKSPEGHEQQKAATSLHTDLLLEPEIADTFLQHPAHWSVYSRERNKKNAWMAKVCSVINDMSIGGGLGAGVKNVKRLRRTNW